MNEYIIFFQKVIPGVNQSTCIMYIQREEQVLQTIAKIQQDNSYKKIRMAWRCCLHA